MSTPQNSISFTNVPNIIKITESNAGVVASCTISITNLSKVNVGTEYTIVINDERFISTNNVEQSLGNKFYLTNNTSKKNLVAFKLCEAFRSSPTLSLNYNIIMESNDNGSYTGNVIIQAKEKGPRFNVSVSGTTISTGILSASRTVGTTTSSFMKDSVNNIVIDVYSQSATTDPIGNATFRKGDYVTTLTKEFFGTECYFNVSPILASLAEYRMLNEVNFFIYSQSDTEVNLIGTINDIYFTNGYNVNQGVKYIPPFTNIYLAQNVSRGSNKGLLNNTILYTYFPIIKFSLFTTSAMNSCRVTTKYINSARTVFAESATSHICSNSYSECTLNLNQENFSKAFYIDVEIQNLGTLRYNVIKPLNATQEVQRIYWSNSYGGVSFFDFTGDRNEQRKTSVSYYQKNMFDYHEIDVPALNNVYDKDVDVTVTLTTHNIEKDGQWSLFDLQNSRYAWTTVNSKDYFITITDIKITETSVPNIYTAQITYTYNTGDTF